jgi:hypothetical protein
MAVSQHAGITEIPLIFIHAISPNAPFGPFIHTDGGHGPVNDPILRTLHLDRLWRRQAGTVPSLGVNGSRGIFWLLSIHRQILSLSRQISSALQV